MSFKSKSCLVVDNGLFSELARTLSVSFGKTYYTSPWLADFPSSSKTEIGEGFPEYERVRDIWDIVDDVDLFVFPDLHQGQLQQYLVSQGKRVWGARHGDELETERSMAKDFFKSLGLPQAHYEVVTGMEKLRYHLQGRQEKVWIKISLTRNDTETFPVESYDLAKNRLDRLEADLGPAAAEMEFIVEDDLPDTIDIAIDTYSIDGKFPKKAAIGTEKKDEGYVCAVKNWKDFPPRLVDIYEILSPTLQKYEYRSTLSLESRIGKDKIFLCDPCCRGGSPPFELQLNMIRNLAEIMWEGADGKLVEPDYVAPYGAQFIIESRWAINNPLRIEFPDKYRDHIKLRYAAQYGRELWIMPQKSDTPAFGSIVVTGNSLDACYEEAAEIGSQIKGIQVETFTGSADALKETLAKLTSWGVSW